MIKSLSLDERYALIKNCLQRLELYLADPNPDLERCRKIIQSALYQAEVVQVSVERFKYPHINTGWSKP